MADCDHLIRSRWILPLSGPAIENGAIAVADGDVQEVGPWPEVRRGWSGPAIDLGESVILPGLLNAHCHLDYTAMAGQITPTRSFVDWIKCITTLKAEWSYSEYAASWIAGARMLLRSGTTFVADTEAVPELLPEVWSTTPLRVWSFLEMTGVRGRRDPRLILEESLNTIGGLAHPSCRALLAPHAPYSTTPGLLQLSAGIVQDRSWPVSIHVAESTEEFQMFTRGGGPLHEWLRRNERDMSDCGRGSPVKHLDRLGLLTARLLAIHVNCLDRGDAALLGRKRASVVHCPRSHHYFSHPPFPYDRLRRAGVNVCLGTDSLVTVRTSTRRLPELSLFEEMKAFAAVHPEVRPATVLAMVTRNPARALGLDRVAGALAPGAWADLAVLPLPNAGPAGGGLERLVWEAPPVAAVMVGGRWVIPPDSTPGPKPGLSPDRDDVRANA